MKRFILGDTRGCSIHTCLRGLVVPGRRAVAKYLGEGGCSTKEREGLKYLREGVAAYLLDSIHRSQNQHSYRQ